MGPLRYGRWDIGGGRRVTPMWREDDESLMFGEGLKVSYESLKVGGKYESGLFEGLGYPRFLVGMKKDGVSVIGGLEYEGYLLGCTGLWGMRCDDGMYEVVDGGDLERIERLR